jgi:hypothetical protein
VAGAVEPDEAAKEAVSTEEAVDATVEATEERNEPTTATAAEKEEEEEEEEEHCRYCFMGAEADKGELCSPCLCSGSMKCVHLQCLQRWQSSTLLAAASREVSASSDATGLAG